MIWNIQIKQNRNQENGANDDNLTHEFIRYQTAVTKTAAATRKQMPKWL